MGPIGHTVISSVLGAAIWFATDSVEAAGVAVGVGVLMDVDHLYDCYQRYIKGNLNKTYCSGPRAPYSAQSDVLNA